MFNFKVFQELAFYSHATFKAHLLGLLGQHISLIYYVFLKKGPARAARGKF